MAKRCILGVPSTNERRAKIVIAPAEVAVRAPVCVLLVVACVTWFESQWMPVAASSDIVSRVGEAAQSVAVQSPEPSLQAPAQR